MDPIPDGDDVASVAASMGITLGRDELRVYTARVRARLEDLEAFMQLEVGEERPPLLSPERDPGHRPSAAEDPFRAWRWKCSISATDRGLLAGKTVGYKDHVAVAGMPFTLNSRLLEGQLADFDATVVTRVLAAGGTVVGKNSMNGPTSGWGSGMPGDYERPLNPHGTEHLSGGSSSGSAVAVAAREVDISFGGDQGGSVRIPAAYCGTLGLKPTFGLISHFGAAMGSDPSIDHLGPIALHAEDIAAALDAVAGYDGLDPRQDRAVPLQVDSLASLADGVGGLRIGILDEGFVHVDADVRDAVEAAIDTLVAAGAEATRTSIPEHLAAGTAHAALEADGSRAVIDSGFFGAFARTWYPPGLTAATYGLFHEHADRLREKVKLALIVSEFSRRRYQGAVYARAQNVRPVFRNAFDRAFGEVDVLAMPTCPSVAPRYVAPESNVDPVAFVGPSIGPGGKPAWVNTVAYDFTGHPALTVPCGKSAGLPIGLQLVGPFHAEARLLRVAYAFEHSVDWGKLTAIDDRSVDKTREAGL